MAIQTSSLMETAGQSGPLLSRPARSWKAALACGSAAILAVAFAVPALTTEAQAAKCPSGQFWRVSKKICQDKSIGYKLGIFKKKKSTKAQRKAKAEPPKPAPEPKPVAAAPAPEAVKSGAAGSPLNAISAATRPDTSRPAEKPLETRLVKATYFTATPPGLAAQTAPANTETARRAVLNLLKSRLHTHAERNRDTIIRRATAQ